MTIILNPVTFANTLRRATGDITFQAIWERKARKAFFAIMKVLQTAFDSSTTFFLKRFTDVNLIPDIFLPASW